MKKYYNIEVYNKNEKGKYKKINDLKSQGVYVLADILNYFERKLDGEKIRIVKHYNYYPQMNVDIYFNNGYKYVYYDIPCNSGARIDTSKLLKDIEE